MFSPDCLKETFFFFSVSGPLRAGLDVCIWVGVPTPCIIPRHRVARSSVALATIRSYAVVSTRNAISRMEAQTCICCPNNFVEKRSFSDSNVALNLGAIEGGGFLISTGGDYLWEWSKSVCVDCILEETGAAAQFDTWQISFLVQLLYNIIIVISVFNPGGLQPNRKVFLCIAFCLAVCQGKILYCRKGYASRLGHSKSARVGWVLYRNNWGETPAEEMLIMVSVEPASLHNICCITEISNEDCPELFTFELSLKTEDSAWRIICSLVLSSTFLGEKGRGGIQYGVEILLKTLTSCKNDRFSIYRWLKKPGFDGSHSSSTWAYLFTVRALLSRQCAEQSAD